MDNKDNQAKIESIINRTDGSLPFGYFNPVTEGKLTWNCGVDNHGKIISIFAYDFGTYKDKNVTELPNIKEATSVKNTLIESGWQKLKAPEILITYADGEKKPMNRKQKRYLASTLEKANKSNPFHGDKDDEEPV